MKKTAIIYLPLLLCCAASKAEVTCRTDIKESDTYKEIGTILSCMSEKIKSIENELAQVKSSPKTNQDGSCSSEKAEKFTSFLKPTVNGSKIKAAITLKNTTSEPLLLVADHDAPASLSDSKFALATSARTAPDGIKSYSQFLNGPALKEEYYTSIAPTQSLTTVSSFEVSQDIKANEQTDITVTLTLLSLSNGKVTRVATSPCASMTFTR